MSIINMNLPEKQIDAIEHMLNLSKLDLTNEDGIPGVDGRTSDAMIRHGMIGYVDGMWYMSTYGIQSYCATILTKYTGETHERIHMALNQYQRLFN